MLAFDTFSKGLFLLHLCFAILIFVVGFEYNYVIITNLIVLGIQWIHAGYQGMVQRSDWHQRFFWGVPLYTLVLTILSIVFISFNIPLEWWLSFLLGGGVVIPNILAGYYAFVQQQYAIKLPVTSDDLIDDSSFH